MTKTLFIISAVNAMWLLMTACTAPNGLHTNQSTINQRQAQVEQYKQIAR